jgi:hypothetical protein
LKGGGRNPERSSVLNGVSNLCGFLILIGRGGFYRSPLHNLKEEENYPLESMHIVPIVLTPVKRGTKYNLVKCSLLLERNGSGCIQVASLEDAKEFCSKNGLVLKGEPLCSKDVVFVEVDPAATILSEFYTWNEVLPSTVPMKEVWRPFVWNDSPIDLWGTNVGLDSIDCMPYSAGHLLNTYFKTSRVDKVDEFHS